MDLRDALSGQVELKNIWRRFWVYLLSFVFSFDHAQVRPVCLSLLDRFKNWIRLLRRLFWGSWGHHLWWLGVLLWLVPCCFCHGGPSYFLWRFSGYNSLLFLVINWRLCAGLDGHLRFFGSNSAPWRCCGWGSWGILRLSGFRSHHIGRDPVYLYLGTHLVSYNLFDLLFHLLIALRLELCHLRLHLCFNLNSHLISHHLLNDILEVLWYLFDILSASRWRRFLLLKNLIGFHIHIYITKRIYN